MIKKIAALVEDSRFEYGIIGLILVNSVLLGLETSKEIVAGYGWILYFGNDLILGVFIIEAALKIISKWPSPGLYFRDGWNLFDFFVIVAALIPAAGEFAMIARMARLMRLLRLVTVSQELRLIVITLIKSIPGMLNILILMGIISYIYAVAGYHYFSDHNPERWGGLGRALITLFQVATLDDWNNIMAADLEVHSMAWIYYISFIVIVAFIVINLFIAVVLNNLDKAKEESLREMELIVKKEETIIEDIKEARKLLSRIERQLEDR